MKKLGAWMAKAAKAIGAAAIGAVVFGVGLLIKNRGNGQETYQYYEVRTKKGRRGFQLGDLLMVALDTFRPGTSAGGGNPIPVSATGQPSPVAAPATSGVGRAAPLLDFISIGESRGSYTIIYSGSPIRPPKPITQMTVSKVRKFQNEMVRAGSRSSAVGKFQIIRKTFDTLAGDRNALFDKNMQDSMGLQLLMRRGYQSYLSGSMSLEKFALSLAKEWASLPVLVPVIGAKGFMLKPGQSYYAGDGLNRASASVSGFRAALQRARG